MKSYYYQFLNFIQEMNIGWYMAIWFVLFLAILSLTIRFFKIYNGTQKNFEKVSLIILAVLLFAFLIFFTYVRK